jgi:uncharacterized RDD family membrane protein YckC
MSEQQRPAPPGWYADPQPSPPGGLRWWDGTRWTPHGWPPGAHDGRPGWWRRAGAWLIDGFIVGAASWVVTLPVQLDLQRDLRVAQERLVADPPGTALSTYWSDLMQAWSDRWVWLGLLPALAALAYHLVMLRSRSATVGKLSLGMRVESASGDARPSWHALVRRVLAQFGPGWLVIPVGFASGSGATIALLFAVAFGWQLLDHLSAAGSGRRALHDLASGTRVAWAS